MSEQQGSGLVAAGQQIPLKGVEIDAKLSGLCSEVTVRQRYENSEAGDVEAVYVFPMEEGAAICAFSARVGDRQIEGRIEEREKAFEIYDDAMADGHGAFLLDQERPNIFTASVGNLKPGTEVEVSVTYVALLNFEGEAIRLMLPSTISPRYVPASEPEVGEPDGDRVNPPTLSQVPYGLNIKVEVDAGSPIRVIESPSHLIRSEIDGNRALVTLSHGDVGMDRDFVLLTETEEPHRPTALAAREADGTRVAMVTFFPDPDSAVQAGNETIFVLDCSGSMYGDSIDQAKRALALCVRALSEEDTFNIVRFGSAFDSLWPKPKRYNQKTLDEASAWIGGVDADMGGTEILSPLQHIMAKPADAKRPRQILLLTDGEVSNEDRVIELCKKHRSTSRIFAFGIGAGASEHLVRGVARASRGAAEFIFPGERIEAKVLRMFRRVATPSFSEIRVDWGRVAAEQAPIECPPVFCGDSLTLFARIKDGHTDAVTLHTGGQSWQIPLELEKAMKAGAIPTLWARHRIRDVEDGRGLRRGSSQQRRQENREEKLVLELGKRYGLMSSVTSYVAVEYRDDNDKSRGDAELRKVPVALTAGWGGHGSVTTRGAPPPLRRAAGPKDLAKVAAFKRMAMDTEETLARDFSDMGRDALGGAPGAGYFPGPSGAGGAPPPPAMRPGGAAPPPAPAPMAASQLSPRSDSTRRVGRAPAMEDKKKKQKAKSQGLLGRIFGAQAKAERGCADAPARSESKRSGEASSSVAVDRLYELLLTQKADGSFPLSSALQKTLGERWERISEAAQRDGDALVATAVVLLLLREDFESREDEWKAAEVKAERWLKKHPDYDANTLI